MMSSRFLNQVAILCPLLSLAAWNVSRVSAAALAFDSAADHAYDAGWLEGSNGGSGWGSGWHFVDPVNDNPPPHFIGNSATNFHGDPEGDGDINTPRSPNG